MLQRLGAEEAASYQLQCFFVQSMVFLTSRKYFFAFIAPRLHPGSPASGF